MSTNDGDTALYLRLVPVCWPVTAECSEEPRHHLLLTRRLNLETLALQTMTRRLRPHLLHTAARTTPFHTLETQNSHFVWY